MRTAHEELSGLGGVTWKGPAIFVNGVHRDFRCWVDVRERPAAAKDCERIWPAERNRCLRFSHGRYLGFFFPFFFAFLIAFFFLAFFLTFFFAVFLTTFFLAFFLSFFPVFLFAFLLTTFFPAFFFAFFLPALPAFTPGLARIPSSPDEASWFPGLTWLSEPPRLLRRDGGAAGTVASSSLSPTRSAHGKAECAAGSG